ncbi:cytochrome [Escherichia coli]|uniref:Cytochrome n=1 Tax=Escherichia coli TaxID=562 RepID=A0A376KTX6_ECOLX|nr:cytochrome [Escherichia coli]
MNRFSKTQIYLHWITLLFVAITYAADGTPWLVS